MASWTVNPIMEWSTDGGATWTKVTDHGRSPLRIAVERIETKQRMADGTLRRYVVSKKRTFSCSWENLPDKATNFLANGQPADWIEAFHNNNDGAFHMRLREGSERDLSLTGLNGTTLQVMITDFSKEITKRGMAFDLVDLDITLEEV